MYYDISKNWTDLESIAKFAESSNSHTKDIKYYLLNSANSCLQTIAVNGKRGRTESLLCL